jgi:excisionase family DNA binding protein
MPRKTEGIGLTPREIAAAFSDERTAGKCPPVMTVDEAADLLRVPKHTIYDWSSRGLLKGCSRRMGKHLRFFRDRLLLHAFNEGIDAEESN